MVHASGNGASQSKMVRDRELEKKYDEERKARKAQAAKERKERFETVAATLNSKAGVEHVKNINDALKKEIADNQKAAEQEAQRSQAAEETNLVQALLKARSEEAPDAE